MLLKASFCTLTSDTKILDSIPLLHSWCQSNITSLLSMGTKSQIKDNMADIKYFRSLFLGFLLGFIIFLLAVFYQIGAPTESSRWIDEIYEIKSSLANSLKTPKLVIISGSNALLGISCKMIYQESKVPCLNGGTNGGIDLYYLLGRPRTWLKPGDLVLLPLEYEYYLATDTPNNVFIDYVFSRDPKYFLSVSLLTQLRLIWGLSFERLFLGIKGKFKPPQPIQSGYQSKTINEYGDDTSYDKTQQTKAKLIPIEIDSEFQQGYATSHILNFVNWCKQNNVQLIVTWPNTLWFDIYQQPSKQEFFQSVEDFYKVNRVPVLGQPKDFMYEPSLFSDTVYHMNAQGVHQRTMQLINLLKPYLEKMPKKAND